MDGCAAGDSVHSCDQRGVLLSNGEKPGSNTDLDQDHSDRADGCEKGVGLHGSVVEGIERSARVCGLAADSGLGATHGRAAGEKQDQEKGSHAVNTAMRASLTRLGYTFAALIATKP